MAARLPTYMAPPRRPRTHRGDVHRAGRAVRAGIPEGRIAQPQQGLRARQFSALPHAAPLSISRRLCPRALPFSLDRSERGPHPVLQAARSACRTRRIWQESLGGNEMSEPKIGRLCPHTWSSEESVAYEAVIEAINGVVGAYSGLIAEARAAPTRRMRSPSTGDCAPPARRGGAA